MSLTISASPPDPTPASVYMKNIPTIPTTKAAIEADGTATVPALLPGLVFCGCEAVDGDPPVVAAGLPFPPPPPPPEPPVTAGPEPPTPFAVMVSPAVKGPGTSVNTSHASLFRLESSDQDESLGQYVL